MEERCEITDLFREQCAHCRKLEEEKENDFSDDDDWLDWLDG